MLANGMSYLSSLSSAISSLPSAANCSASSQVGHTTNRVPVVRVPVHSKLCARPEGARYLLLVGWRALALEVVASAVVSEQKTVLISGHGRASKAGGRLKVGRRLEFRHGFS